MKLTNEMRDTIVAKAIAAAFDQRERDFAVAEDGLAREAYAQVYPAEVLKLANALPSNWLQYDICINYTASGMRFTLRTVTNHLRVPYTVSGTSSRYCHNSHGELVGELADRVVAHATAKDKADQEKKQVKRQLQTMLSSITTLAKLKETWPEGASAYAHLSENKPYLPPAIRTDEINALLGLKGIAQ